MSISSKTSRSLSPGERAVAFAINTLTKKDKGSRTADNLKKALGLRSPGFESESASARSVIRDYAIWKAKNKTSSGKKAQEAQEKSYTAETPKKTQSAALHTGQPKASSGATYNRNFEVSKAGAGYVNKNSPFGRYSITSYTGPRNTAVAGASSNHAGVDRAVPEGTGICVPFESFFKKRGSDSARGNWIELKDKHGNILHYQHLKSVAAGLKPGEAIGGGTVFAVSGSTGVGRAHLHEEYYTPDGKTNITESYWNKYAPLR